MRIPFCKQFNLEEFEFSQGYLFYWDKIERSYYFLNNIVDVAKRGEAVDGRLMAFLLNVCPIFIHKYNKYNFENFEFFRTQLAMVVNGT